jgi:hypothetical protein
MEPPNKALLPTKPAIAKWEHSADSRGRHIQGPRGAGFAGDRQIVRRASVVRRRARWAALTSTKRANMGTSLRKMPGPRLCAMVVPV